MKFIDKLKPKNIIRYISSHKRTIFFNSSMFFLCLSLIFTVLFGMLEREGIFQSKSGPENTQAPSATIKPRDRNDYISVNMGGEPLNLNSITAEDTITKTILRHMLEGLYRLGQDGKPIPAVAESYTLSADKLTWTFSLRSDSLWQDGAIVVSGDFKAAVDLHISENSPYKAQMAFIDKIECPNANTLVFKLKEPNNNFLELLCQSQFMPIQKALYEANKASYGKEATDICYNGPWYVQQWVHNQKLIMSKNDSYWNKDNIALNNLLFITGGTQVSKLENLKSNNYDMVYISPAEIDMYKDAGCKVESYYDGHVVYLEFNKENALLKNEDLQKALSLSINRDSFVKDVIKSGAKSVEGYDFSKDLETAKQALEKAKEALKKDLAADLIITVDNETINLTEDSKNSFSPSEVYAKALAKQWKDNLGIDVSVEALSYGERIEKIKKGTLMITINSMKYTGTLPAAPLYYKNTVYATNGLIKNIITDADRELDLYFATL